MAINTKQFVNKVKTGLKADTEYKRFYYRFKLDGKIKHGVLDYTAQAWDKKTRISKAEQELANKKEHTIYIEDVGFTENSSLDKVAKVYFSLACDDTRWTADKRADYNNYIGDCRTDVEIKADAELKANGKPKRVQPQQAYKIGKKKIKDISLVNIDAIKRGMEKEGLTVQSANGCSPRTIKKLLVQVLKPILQYAKEAGVISRVPKIVVPKQTAKKKRVTNATETLATLYKTINTMYADDSFYKALFMFALYGRRLNEILTLEWHDINTLNGTYTIREENSKTIEQTFDLPPVIAEALADMPVNREGLIFASPKTGKKLSPPKRQLEKLKLASGVDDLTFHKFRHIMVSAMSESGIVSSVLSASLGHANSLTTEKHYITQNHVKASKEANKAIAGLIS